MLGLSEENDEIITILKKYVFVSRFECTMQTKIAKWSSDIIKLKKKLDVLFFW